MTASALLMDARSASAAAGFAHRGDHPHQERQLLRLLRSDESLVSIRRAWLSDASDSPLLVAATDSGDLLVVSLYLLRIRVPKGSWHLTTDAESSVWRFTWWRFPIQLRNVRRRHHAPPSDEPGTRIYRVETTLSGNVRSLDSSTAPSPTPEKSDGSRRSWRRLRKIAPMDTPAETEHFAAQHMRKLGFKDAVVTQLQGDGGVDVRAGRGQAQVKASATRVGRPALQQLVGACRGPWRLFYSLSGYTSGAITYANAERIALFIYTLDREAHPYNKLARELSRHGPRRRRP